MTAFVFLNLPLYLYLYLHPYLSSLIDTFVLGGRIINCISTYQLYEKIIQVTHSELQDISDKQWRNNQTSWDRGREY